MAGTLISFEDNIVKVYYVCRTSDSTSVTPKA